MKVLLPRLRSVVSRGVPLPVFLLSAGALAQLVPDPAGNAPAGDPAVNSAAVNSAAANSAAANSAAANSAAAGNAAANAPVAGGSGFDLPTVLDAISRHTIALVYLGLAFALIYGAGWLVMRSLIGARNGPGDSGCLGCLFSVGLGLVFLFTVFFGVLIAPMLPPTLFWALLLLVGIALLVFALAKGGPLKVPLALIVVLVLVAAGGARHFLLERPVGEPADRPAPAPSSGANSVNAAENAGA